jgi:hypothetical protein
MTCLQTGSVGEITYAEEWINFYLHFAHLLFDFGKIWYKSSAYNKTERLWISWISAQGCIYFYDGCKLNQMFRLYQESVTFLELKTTMIKSVL